MIVVLIRRGKPGHRHTQREDDVQKYTENVM